MPYCLRFVRFVLNVASLSSFNKTFSTVEVEVGMCYTEFLYLIWITLLFQWVYEYFLELIYNRETALWFYGAAYVCSPFTRTISF